MSMLRLVLPAFLLTTSSFCYATDITDNEADAFVSAYSLEVLEALVGEEISIRASLGQIDGSISNCIHDKLVPGDIFQRIRPYVKESFRSKKSLNDAMNFFLSPTGIKLREFGKSTLTEYMRAKASNQPAPTQPPIPPSFSDQDVVAANEFNDSESGKDFAVFVNKSLPKLKAGEKFREVAINCLNNKNQ